MKEKLKELLFENIANVVTLMGLFLASWAAFIALFSPEKIWLIFLLVFLSGLSDFIDGKIARKLGAESNFGKALDRIRDKVLIGPLLFIFIFKYLFLSVDSLLFTFTVALASVALILELLLVLAWLLGIIKEWNVESSVYGRRKVFFQFLAIAVWVTALFLEKYLRIKILFPSIILVNVILVISIALGAISLVVYCNEYQNRGEKPRKGEKR